jgi:prevent-host-death family protein
MKTITATAASRQFSDLLDTVERGETFTVTRGGRAVAEIKPARPHTGRDLREALETTDAPDAGFESDIAEALTFLNNDLA